MPTQEVFVIHGHDEGMKHSVARFLAVLGLEPIVLQEQPNCGSATIIEKLESKAELDFAVVLLSPDDHGHRVGFAKERRFRARQNCILELGFFAARLGRRRIVVMKKGDLELPSDCYGLVYTDFDDAGAWKMRLAKELKVAGFQIDGERLLASIG